MLRVLRELMVLEKGAYCQANDTRVYLIDL